MNKGCLLETDQKYGLGNVQIICDPLRGRGGVTQGGILAGSQGARLPRNLQTHTKFLQKFTLFLHEFDFKVFPYFLSNEGILPITHNMPEIFSCQRKKHIGTASN